MAAHYVTCVYCKERFNRDNVPTTQVSARRYAHKECAEEHEKNKSQEEKDQEALEKYIMKLFDESYVNARVRKQIKDYQKEYNYTYSGMLKTLIYWYEIKGNSTEKANGGIGIIPYIYNDALKYYYSLYLAKIANENKDIEEYKPKIKMIEIYPPTVPPKVTRLFNLDDSEEEDE
jgi:hypothetical protein